MPAAGIDGKRNRQYTFRDGRKAPLDPQGLKQAKRELAAGSRPGHGRSNGERLASLEGALAELDSASALLERESVRGLGWRAKELALQCMRFVVSSDGDEGVKNTFQSGCRARPDS